MTLTLTQIANRAGDLSGELKAAYTALAECEAAEGDAERPYIVAKRATERARERLATLQAERETLAHEAHSAIMAKGEPVPLADESGPNVEVEVIGVIPPNAPPMIRLDPWAEGGATNGIDRAFEEATNPHD